MVQINEFHDTYPNWDLGFMATNPMTATEKLFGMRMMSLCYNPKRNRTYQEFPISKEQKDIIMTKYDDGKAHCFEGNNIRVVIKVMDNTIVGCCLQTKERVIFDTPMDIVIPGEHGFSDENNEYRRRQQEDLYK